ELCAPETRQRPGLILNNTPVVIAVEAAAEVQKQVRSLREWVVREGSKNQVQFWTGDGLGSGAGDRLGSRSGLSHIPPEVVESRPELTAKPVSRSNFLVREPAQIGLVNEIVVCSAQSVALLLVEEAELDVVEPALKAKKGFSGDNPKRIVAPVYNVVADKEWLVILFDAVTLLRVIEKESEV